ncbi:MAG TPA: hypothetical protein VNL70_08805 [Tepidisphaeraceae bacterium]|nr:hypothetical protein [Tepidisphaeraceae bacterium]
MRNTSASTVLMVLLTVGCFTAPADHADAQVKQPPPQSAPTTAPAADHPDALEQQQLDFLKCAMGSFYMGLFAEDPLVIRAFIHCQNDPDHILVEAYTRRILANMRFVRAAWKFGIDHGEEPFDKYHIFLPDDVAFGLVVGGWEIRGNVATVPPEERMGESQPPPPPLINVRGVWKINLTPADGPQTARELAARIHKYTDVLEQTTKDVVEGRLTSIEQIAQALDAAPQFGPAQHEPELILTLPEQAER